MKKIIAAVLVALCMLTVIGCTSNSNAMTYEQYAAAELNTPVTVRCYVQATQSWWEDKISIYAADRDGAYFIYNAACTEATSKKLLPGTEITVTGTKSEWNGEVEIIDATLTVGRGSYVAPVTDVTALLGTEDLIKQQNKFVSFTDMVVEASKDADGNDVAFLYNYDGSGESGSDLYFNVSSNGKTYTFTVESYLCGADTDVYKAVEGLNIGDKVDLKGFLYWYEGANPHITNCTVKK